jgi:hypothetical protein
MMFVVLGGRRWWAQHIGLGLAVVLLCTGSAEAQLAAAHPLMAYGPKSGTQPPPVVLLALNYANWDVNHIVGRNGDQTPFDLSLSSLGFYAWVVTPRKVLGGTYGFQLFVPVVASSLELPRLGFTTSSSLALSDIYVQPVNLGWHSPRADYMAGLGLYAPTGEYEPGGNENKGLGMWTLELSGGSTLYFDPGRRYHVAALVSWETHSNKEDQDLKAGNVLTVEGGLGGRLVGDKLQARLAYGAQWKISDDSGDDFPAGLEPDRNHLYTVGPELVYTGLYKAPNFGSITARYLWDVGARSSFEGNRFVVFISFGGLLDSPGTATTSGQ